MIELAQKKMPNAHLYQGDFSEGLVESLLQHTYDFIIATYSLHHLTDDAKIQFIQLLKTLLKEGGYILIGDVAFQTRSDLEKCHKENKDGWDEDEIYFVVDELRKAFPELEFIQVSYCAGLLVIKM